MYGIEIHEWPVRIAEAALWLMDHQMNLRLSEAFGQYFVRLPLQKSPRIVQGNALRLDWKELLPPGQCSYILGNPPFVGAKFQTADQRADMDLVAGHVRNSGLLDYVTGWYFKAADYIRDTRVVVGFVSTNSISQGEQVSRLVGRAVPQLRRHDPFRASDVCLGKRSSRQSSRPRRDRGLRRVRHVREEDLRLRVGRDGERNEGPQHQPVSDRRPEPGHRQSPDAAVRCACDRHRQQADRRRQLPVHARREGCVPRLRTRSGAALPPLGRLQGVHQRHRTLVSVAGRLPSAPAAATARSPQIGSPPSAASARPARACRPRSWRKRRLGSTSKTCRKSRTC